MIKLNTADLKREMKCLSFISERKTTIPILSHLLITTEGKDLVTITSTNLDTYYQCDLEGKAKKKETFVIDTALLAGILKFADETITIGRVGEGDGLRVLIGSGKAAWSIHDMDAAAFPEIPPFPTRLQAFPFDVFRSAITQTRYAVVNEQSRFTLSGAKTVINGNFKMVTTDGHRLCLFSKEIKTRAKFDALVPSELLDLCGRIKKTDSFSLAVKDGRLFFKTDTARIIGRALSGQFPNYEMVIPKDNDQNVKVDAIALKEAVKQAQIGMTTRHKAINWHLENGISEITTKDPENEFKTQLVVSGFEGDVTFGINPAYLEDFCKRHAGVINVNFKDKDTQMSFSPVDQEDGSNLQYILMPLKIA